MNTVFFSGPSKVGGRNGDIGIVGVHWPFTYAARLVAMDGSKRGTRAAATSRDPSSFTSVKVLGDDSSNGLSI